MRKRLRRLKNAVTCNILFITIIATAFLYQCSRPTSLKRLQEAIMAENTERKQVLHQLEEYYLTMSIPDTIRLLVFEDIDSLIKKSKEVTPRINVKANPEANIYKIETILKDTLRAAIIACVRGDNNTFESIIHRALLCAMKVDSLTENNYWIPHVIKVADFDSCQGMNWLVADRAASLCFTYHNNASTYKAAEKLAALSLQYLEFVEDERIRLDIMQRIQVMLYNFQSYFELSYALAERAIQKSKALKYHLRTTGLTYNYANALCLAGQNQLAYEKFKEVINKSDKFASIPIMMDYRILGRLGIIHVYWQLGEYEKGISVCEELSRFPLYNEDKIILHIEQGLIHQKLGNFETAENEYKKSLLLAEHENDVPNQIASCNNLGWMNHNLYEYGLADSFYYAALNLIDNKMPESLEMRCKVLIGIADLRAEQGELEDFDKYASEVNELVESINLPNAKAEILRAFGRLYLKTKNMNEAANYFVRAIALYEKYNLLLFCLETKIDLVKCFIGLNKYQDAKQLLEEVYEKADEISDALRLIDAIGLMAELEGKLGNIENAIQISNKLERKIEDLSRKFTDRYNLTIFLQRSYDYLKKAAIYEIEGGRIDSAFVKLDQAKARALKTSLPSSIVDNVIGKTGLKSPLALDSIKMNMKAGQLLISYLLGEEKIYAFVLSNQGLELFEKSVNKEDLRKLTNNYLKSINKTISLFDNGKTDDFSTHYDSVAIFSKELYGVLINWQELEKSIQHADITYIIPDDFIFGIPFSCLMNSNKNESQFLIQQTAIVNLPSATFLQLNQSDTKNDIRNKRVLFIVDRSFEGAKDFIKFIREQFSFAEELVINKAVIKKEDVISKLNEGFEIYFFYGHSSANFKIPDLSYLRLNLVPGVDSSETAIKFLISDLKKVDWSRAESVFLLGCETAPGRLRKGTGLAGIQQTILTLGAQEVFACLWKVDSQLSDPLFKDFIKYWVQNKNLAIALQLMQINTIRNYFDDPYYKKPHPYIWGPFTISRAASY